MPKDLSKFLFTKKKVGSKKVSLLEELTFTGNQFDQSK